MPAESYLRHLPMGVPFWPHTIQLALERSPSWVPLGSEPGAAPPGAHNQGCSEPSLPGSRSSRETTPLVWVPSRLRLIRGWGCWARARLLLLFLILLRVPAAWRTASAQAVSVSGRFSPLTPELRSPSNCPWELMEKQCWKGLGFKILEPRGPQTRAADVSQPPPPALQDRRQTPSPLPSPLQSSLAHDSESWGGHCHMVDSPWVVDLKLLSGQQSCHCP